MLTIRKIVQLHPISVDAMEQNTKRTEKYFALAKQHLSSLFWLIGKMNASVNNEIDIRFDEPNKEFLLDGIAYYKKWLGEKTWDKRYKQLSDLEGWINGIQWDEHGMAKGFE